MKNTDNSELLERVSRSLYGNDKTIADLTKEEITHNMIFDLWFKVDRYTVSGLMGRKSKQVKKTQPMWVKVFGYLPEEDMYLLNINDKMSKADLLNYEYATYPREVYS